MERDLEYEKNNIGYDHQYTEEDGGGIKCNNYELCKVVLPNWWFDCKGKYICTICDTKFGKILEMRDSAECSSCLEEKRSIVQPKCIHSLCIECFKRSWFGDESREEEPVFPYPHIEDEYEVNQENPKWYNEYPLIRTWNIEWNKWNDKKEEQYANEENLRRCHVCRS